MDGAWITSEIPLISTNGNGTTPQIYPDYKVIKAFLVHDNDMYRNEHPNKLLFEVVKRFP